MPKYADVGSGDIRVYFTGSQGADFSEPPGYTAPTDWPEFQYGVFRRPKTFRLITDVYESSGDVTGTDTTLHFISRIPETQSNVDVGPFCSCTDLVFIPELGLSVVPEAITLEFMNTNYEPITGDPETFSSVSPSSGGDCTCSAGGGGGGDVNQSYRTEASTYDLPAHSTRFITSEMPTTNYLSAVSVASGDVPGGVNDYSFIGGKVLTVYLFGSNDANAEYTAATIAASDLGQRIIAAYPKFRQYRTVLAVNDAGDVSAGLKTKLQGIAAAFADVGFVYVVWDGVSDMTAYLDSFFQ